MPRTVHQLPRGSVRVGNPRRDVAPLVSAYLELVTDTLPASERHAVAVAASLACTPERLAALVEAVDDPFAWVPFLRCVAVIPANAQTPESSAALAHIHALGTAFLAERGLSVLIPEDVILTEGPLERAASELCSG